MAVGETATDRARVLLAEFLSAATAPDVTEPVPAAPLASWLLRSSGAQHEIYLKTANIDVAGWSRQNYDLRVFNMVLDFGCVGDGTTDNRAQINSGIAAANAVGGAILYFPPGQYAVLKPGAGTLDLCPLSNVANITFLGDGKASQIRIAGNQFATQTVLFRLHNFTKGIRFESLFIDAALATNIEATNQNHLIQPQGAFVDPPGSGAQDLDIIGCYFGQAHGDQIRLAADTGVLTSDFLILYNDMDGRDPLGARGSRSAISFQRGVTRVVIQNNFMTGILNGQLIDFEPSGTAQISDIDIIGNQLDHNSQGSPAFTIGGTSGSPATRVVIAFNTIATGGGMVGQLVDRHTIIGNVIILDSSTATNGVLSTQDSQTNFAVVANCLIVTDATTPRIPLSLVATSTDPLQCTIIDNVVRGANCGNFGNGAAFLDCQGAKQLLSSGNIWTGDITVSPSVGLKYRSGSFGGTDHVDFSQELVVPDAGSAANTVSGIQISASNADNLGNSVVKDSYVRNPGTGTVIEWLNSGGAVLVDWRYCGDNLCIGGSTASVAPPTTNVGVTGSGTAGPGPQIAITAVTPVANVNAPAGSMATNQGGGVATTIFAKETGAGVSGGTGGWVGIGPHELVFGVQDTTATLTTQFLAPGSDLAAASTTTIELVVPRPCRVRSWRVHQIPGTGAGNITYNVRKNNVVQSGTIVIAFTTASGGPTGSFDCVAGDRLSVTISKSQAPATNPKNVVFTLELAA